MMYLTGIAALIIWVYLLSVLKRCKSENEKYIL